MLSAQRKLKLSFASIHTIVSVARPQMKIFNSEPHFTELNQQN